MGVTKTPDFGGYATKAGLKCTDGRTIMPEAFKHQDKVQVPLVWQHGHKDPENVLGHVLLEARKDGMYAHCFFNNTKKATHAKALVDHKDITQLSIWANNLVERAKMVFHGAIREVSLVLAGANPGAVIDNITVQHSDGEEETLEDEALIYTGLSFQHADDDDDVDDDTDDDDVDDDTVKDVVNSMTPKQQEVLHYMIGKALEAAPSVQHDDTKGDKDVKVKHSIFEDKDDTPKDDKIVLSHDDMKGIVADAAKCGSLKQATENYALQHGIENIGLLFPEAKNLDDTPQFLSRDMAWVGKVLDGARKSPFSRIKSRFADLTFEEARAKGYIKGNFKKEEFFALRARITTPTTFYKKQKLDRDDIIDITDFDVVAWMKAEMRLLLNEELARAVLIGDGRDPGDEDKIREENIRPIAKDDPLFVVTVNVDLNNANSSYEEVLDAIILNRQYYKGTGNPTMFTTETFIARALLIRDTTGRRIYPTIADLKAFLRVDDIVAVEVLDSEPDIAAILVNMIDYNMGADKGGEVTMFDDFDIDYNQYKYLIEGRCSAALVKPKSAIIVRTTGAGDVAATATQPAWNAATFTVTIPDDDGVVYVNADTSAILAAGAVVVDEGTVLIVRALAENGRYLTNSKVEWSYMHHTGA